MRILAILFLAVGIVIAGGAAFYAKKMYEAQISLSRAEPSTVKLLAANRTLEPGTLLTIEHLKLVEWPRWSAPPGTFTSTSDVFGDDRSDVRYVMNTIQPGELILDGKLSEPNQSGRLSWGIEDDQRAVSIPINAETGVGGFISPGDEVDILLTHEVEGNTVNRVLLQKIRILAIDQENYTETNSPRVGRTATLAVSTVEAQTVVLARQKGNLSLILRKKGAPIDANSKTLDMRELNGLPDTGKKKTIRTRKGGVVDDVEVD